MGDGVVACFRRIETVLSLETPSSHVKLAQAKVERRLTLLCMKGDHRLYDLQFYFLFYASMVDMSTVARNRTISHNTNIVFSLGGHRLEGSPIWLMLRTYRSCPTYSTEFACGWVRRAWHMQIWPC